MDREFAIRKTINSEEIKRIRKKCDLSRKEFASLLSVSVKTVEYWENGKAEVSGPLCFALKMLDESPELTKKYEIEPQEYPLRLLYMLNGEVCTVIDADEMHRKVRIKNYTETILNRAFGTVTEPDYDAFEEFLKDRCFPETRDKMKLQLEQLGLPFYDPMLIIEKTGGRMAEDNFYIEVIRKW